MKRFVFALALVLLYQGTSDACNRCGLFGNRCKFVAHTYVAPVVAPAYAAQPVYVVQNNYPQPLVSQGSTNYSATSQSYQQSVLPLLDVNRYFSQTLELQKAATATQALQSERALTVFQRVAELQAPSLERYAAGSAAAMVLQAAGLDPTVGNSNSQAVVISRDSQGKLQILPLSAEQTLKVTQKITTKAEVAPPPGGETPFLAKYCYACHGLEKAEPKGKFYLGNDPTVAKAMKSNFFKITQQIRTGKMPPADAPQPTKEEKALILDEVQELILSHSEGVEDDPK